MKSYDRSRFPDDDQVIVQALNSSNTITGAAKIYAKHLGIPYSDNLRRDLSRYINRQGYERQDDSNTLTQTVAPTKSKFEEDVKKGTATFEGTVTYRIKTLEEALEVANVDPLEWEVERWICNAWEVTSWKNGEAEVRTNHQVKVWLVKKKETLEEVMGKLLPEVLNYEEEPLPVAPGTGVGVVSMADFHIGAEVSNLQRSPDFNIEILLGYLNEAVSIINLKGYKEVHLNLLGDFIESFTGLNHENTFKSLGKDMWGANVMMVADEIISNNLIAKINNLASINMVSGNHDRSTISKKVDNTGEMGKMLWYMFTTRWPDMEINYHNSVLAKEIDGINYLLTHGDKPYSKANFAKFVLDYGQTGIYNVVLEGHLHSRISVKNVAVEKKVYGDVEVVCYDDGGYRKLVVPALFTGNWYSESLGYASSAGFIMMENNGRGVPNVSDIAL